MTLTLELTEEEAARLEALAKAQGEDVTQVAHDLLVADLLRASVGSEDSVIRLMTQWIAEDTTDDPEELQRREAEWKELETNLEANRLSLRVPKV